MQNNSYVKRMLGAVVSPYESSWQLDYADHYSYNHPAVQTINNFLDTIEKIGIQV